MPSKVTHFASIQGTKALLLVECNPPQELKRGQIALTKAEFDLLSNIRSVREFSGLDLALAHKLLTGIMTKVKALQVKKKRSK